MALRIGIFNHVYNDLLDRKPYPGSFVLSDSQPSGYRLDEPVQLLYLAKVVAKDD